MVGDAGLSLPPRVIIFPVVEKTTSVSTQLQILSIDECLHVDEKFKRGVEERLDATTQIQNRFYQTTASCGESQVNATTPFTFSHTTFLTILNVRIGLK